jgi:hypothetical protein
MRQVAKLLYRKDYVSALDEMAVAKEYFREAGATRRLNEVVALTHQSQGDLLVQDAESLVSDDSKSRDYKIYMQKLRLAKQFYACYTQSKYFNRLQGDKSVQAEINRQADAKRFERVHGIEHKTLDLAMAHGKRAMREAKAAQDEFKVQYARSCFESAKLSLTWASELEARKSNHDTLINFKKGVMTQKEEVVTAAAAGGLCPGEGEIEEEEEEEGEEVHFDSLCSALIAETQQQAMQSKEGQEKALIQAQNILLTEQVLVVRGELYRRSHNLTTTEATLRAAVVVTHTHTHTYTHTHAHTHTRTHTHTHAHTHACTHARTQKHTRARTTRVAPIFMNTAHTITRIEINRKLPNEPGCMQLHAYQNVY